MRPLSAESTSLGGGVTDDGEEVEELSTGAERKGGADSRLTAVGAFALSGSDVLESAASVRLKMEECRLREWKHTCVSLGFGTRILGERQRQVPALARTDGEEDEIERIVF